MSNSQSRVSELSGIDKPQRSPRSRLKITLGSLLLLTAFAVFGITDRAFPTVSGQALAQPRSTLYSVAAPTGVATYPPTPIPGNASQAFAETGHTVTGIFLDYWNNNGGLTQQGYPISDMFTEVSPLNGQPYTIQYFERTVFEYHAENQPPYNVLLSQLGTYRYQAKYPNGAPDQTANTSAGSVSFDQTGHRLGGRFLDYWQKHGGVAQQGYPISDEFQEKSDLDGKTYTVQYFERAVFEYHPENEGTDYAVLLSQLGRFRYDELYPEQSVIASPTALATQTISASDTPTATQIPVAPDITDWIRTHAVQFNSAEPGGDDSDLMPLIDLIGDARIVSLGEATHGTHEFFAMKDRVLRFLVERMGFNVFSMEASAPESDLMNEYVQTGQGNPAALLQGLYFWTWDTQEVLDMIKWMRAHNQDPGSSPTVSFRGFDMQYPSRAMKGVKDYVQLIDTATYDTLQDDYSCYAPYTEKQAKYAPLPEATKTACRDKLKAAYDLVSSKQADYTAKTSAADFAQALHDARMVIQAEDYFSSTDSVHMAAARDAYMAENAAWLLDQAGPNARTVIWAHNAHVATAQYITGADSMGQHLRAQFGDQMRVIGFDFYKGSFNAISVHDGTLGYLLPHQIESSPQGSYEYYLHSAGYARMLFDLRNVPLDTPATSWLAGPRGYWLIGAGFDDDHPDDYSISDARLPEMFDAIFYFDEITASQLLQ